MRARTLGYAAGLFVLVAGGALAMIAPPLATRTRLGRELAALDAELAKPIDGPDVIDRLTADLDTLRAMGRGRMTPIPEESDVAGLMSAITTILNDTGLDKRDMTTRPLKTLDDASALPVTILLEGPFPSVHHAIERIEAMPRLVRVERLRIAAADERAEPGTADGRVRAEVSIDAFFAATTPPRADHAQGDTP